MTECDKMQEHQIYNDFDDALFNLRVEAKNCSRSLTARRMKRLNALTYPVYPVRYTVLTRTLHTLQ